MPILLLVRHGENDYVKKGRLAGRLPGVHLNEKGRSQAKILAEAMVRKMVEAPVRAVYSSPLERTMETAEPIAEALGHEVIPRVGLIETDYGEWQNKTLKGLRRLKLWRVVQHTPSMSRFPGGESFAEAQHRICQEIETLCQQHEQKDVIVCVTHADPIKLAVAFYIGMPLDTFQRLSVAPASLTALHIGETGCSLLNLNYDLSFNLSNP